MKKVIIPTCANPFEVIVNGRKYIYPAGTEQEVPDEVAALIENHYDAHNDYGCGAVEKNEFAIGYGMGYADGGVPFKDFIEGTLTEIYNSDITKIAEGTFDCNIRIKTIDAPNVLTVGRGAFEGSCVECVNFPKLKRIESHAFFGGEIKTLDAPCLEYIGYSVFSYTPLSTLILRNTSVVCSAADDVILYDCPIGVGEGYVYVPRALIDSYKAATNWSAYADRFRVLEDYTLDGTTTGALDENKI